VRIKVRLKETYGTTAVTMVKQWWHRVS